MYRNRLFQVIKEENGREEFINQYKKERRGKGKEKEKWDEHADYCIH